MERLNGLDLFSGIGGNTLGLRQYIDTIAYCEADRHAQSVLLSRMSEGLIDHAPIWDDVTTLRGDLFDVRIDIIVGGFPCQDISTAGRGKGLAGERSGLFFEIMRLVDEIKPPFVFLENVPNIRTKGLDIVLREFTLRGYDTRWTVLSAAEVGANHKRERWFILANAKKHDDRGKLRNMADTSSQVNEPENKSKDKAFESLDSGENSSVLADADCKPHQSQSGGMAQTQRKTGQQEWRQGLIRSSSEYGGQWWQTEPDVGRVADGIPLRVDRIKRLGNAVVPLQAKKAFERLMLGGIG